MRNLDNRRSNILSLLLEIRQGHQVQVLQRKNPMTLATYGGSLIRSLERATM